MDTILKNLGQKVYCTNCKGQRNHQILSTYSQKSHPHLDEFQWHEDYHIVKCAGCEVVAFVKQSGDEDSWEYDNYGNREWVDTFKVYPEEPKPAETRDVWWEQQKIKKKDFKHSPEILVGLYEQIIESYNNKHFILCSFGLRTLIEGICSHQGIKKGYIYDRDENKKPNNNGVIAKSESLGGRIFGLYETGKITFVNALVLQEVKEIGNSAIHEIIIPDRDTIQKIIHTLEEVIHLIYELKNHPLLNK